MPVETVISLVIAFCALLFTALSFKRTANHDTSASATERATMTADIRYIRTSVDEIKLDNKAMRADLDKLNVKVAEVEASSKSAHKRLDDLIRKGE